MPKREARALSSADSLDTLRATKTRSDVQARADRKARTVSRSKKTRREAKKAQPRQYELWELGLNTRRW